MGRVELEPDVRDWYLALDDEQQGRVDFHLAKRSIRITYWIAPGRRMILLTVFVKTKAQERRQIERAMRAMMRCAAEEHMAEDDDD